MSSLLCRTRVLKRIYHTLKVDSHSSVLSLSTIYYSMFVWAAFWGLHAAEFSPLRLFISSYGRVHALREIHAEKTLFVCLPSQGLQLPRSNSRFITCLESLPICRSLLRAMLCPPDVPTSSQSLLRWQDVHILLQTVASVPECPIASRRETVGSI